VAKSFITALFLVLLGQTTGAFSALGNCNERCAAEQGGAASCLPGCADCACCGLTRVLLQTPHQDAPTLRTVQRVWSAPLSAIASPDPEDILHVPKPLLV
jgi:hypothetical protein